MLNQSTNATKLHLVSQLTRESDWKFKLLFTACNW